MKNRTTITFREPLHKLLREEVERTGMSISSVVEWYLLAGMEYGKMPSSREAVQKAVSRIRSRLDSEMP